MVSLTTFITLLTHFNILKRRTDQDSPGFYFGGVCMCVFLYGVDIGNHASKSSTQIYN